MKTTQDNDVIYRIGVVYTENDIKISWPIGLGEISIKTRQDNNVTDHTSLVYSEIETKLLGTIKLGVVFYENQIGLWHDWSYRCGLWWKLDKTTTWLII